MKSSKTVLNGLNYFICRFLMTLFGFISLSAKDTSASNTTLRTQDLDPIAEVWPLRQLFTAPNLTPLARDSELQVDGLEAFYYEGLPYNGKPTGFFAYFGLPTGDTPEGGWPAVVLAHGGGGTAYAGYVKQWNRWGYAAIAMDLYGTIPAKGVSAKDRAAVAARFSTRTTGVKRTESVEDWAYHAAGALVLANSLLHQDKKIDKDRIGLVGTSWGAVHACIAAGLDKRFKIVIPVYGAGFFPQLPWWDPTHFLPKASMPFFWINGTEDGNFPTDRWQKSIDLCPGTVGSSLVIHLGHSDGGQIYSIIPEVIDDIFMNRNGMPRFEKPIVTGRVAQVGYRTSRPVVKAVLCFTTDIGAYSKRVWQTLPAEHQKGRISATLPDNTTAFYFNIYQEPATSVPPDKTWPFSSSYIEM